jgi:porin
MIARAFLDRRSGRMAVLLLMTAFHLGMTRPAPAEEAVPRNMRSKEATGKPLELPERDLEGVKFPLDITTEILGNLSGGTEKTVIWEGLLIAGVEVDLEKTAGLRGLRLTLSGLYAAGPSLTNEAVHDFNTLSNIDAFDSVRLYEAWLQQEFWDGQFSIRLGQILADAEFFVSDYGKLLVNSSFGALPLVSQNLEPPIFPLAAPGLRMGFAPNESFYTEAAFFSGKTGDPATDNQHGLRFTFPEDDGVLLLFELGYRVNVAAASRRAGGLAGTYKLGGFYDSAAFDDPSGRGRRRGRYGIYLVVEQEFWHSEENRGSALAFFGRLGVAPRDRNLVPLYLEVGMNFRGLLPTRAADTAGIGFSYTQLSDRLQPGGGHEEIVELTYQAALRDHVFLQPDLQFIFRPGAIEPAATAIVAGLRINISY